MKYLKRLLILFLFLFIIPITFADITITLPEKSMYNLGEKIAPDISIKQEDDYDGFFKLHISCDDYDLQYYTTPLNLEAGLRMQLTVPELSLSESMVTKCKLKSNFEATDGENIDTEWSKDFFVTDKVDMAIEGDFEAKPGEDISISGEIRKQSNELMPKGQAKISFRGNEETVDVVNGKFEHVIHLEENAEAGNIPILITATDRYGNYGVQSLSVKILSIPTRIENSFENGVLMPQETFKARVVIYDHTNRPINGSKINVKIFAPDEKLLAEKDIQSMNYFEFKTEKTQMPGKYRLLSAFEGMEEQSTFEIRSVRKIIMTQENYFVHIENTGNVEYKDEVTIVLESDDENYLINKKINLEPGERTTIDLSKEVPQGTYDIVLPEEYVEEPAADIQNADVSDPVNVVKDVLIDDNRNIVKRVTGSVSTITTAVVGAAGYVASRPVLASAILVLIVLGTVTRYSWRFIKNKAKGKKEEDTSNLFEDFKFEEEK